ncbi:type IV pilus modification protein PilV [Undibacterium parvum]|nr:type IV pilus modification protein PilV [Undibacterium parvum]
MKRMKKQSVMCDAKVQSGMTLLEVMIAILLLAFGLIGLGATQSKSIVMNQSVFYRSIAVDLGNDLADRIRALRTPFVASADATPAPGKPADFSKCSPNPASCSNQDADRNTYQALVNAEMLEWNTVLKSQLPAASFTLSAVAAANPDYFRYTLTITWLDNRKDNSNSSYSVVIE